MYLYLDYVYFFCTVMEYSYLFLYPDYITPLHVIRYSPTLPTNVSSPKNVPLFAVLHTSRFYLREKKKKARPIN